MISVAGLKQLDEARTSTIEQAREFFAPYAARFPEVYATYGFDAWLGFMTSNFLVTRINDQLEVSEFGHDFLIWLREVRLTEKKPL